MTPDEKWKLSLCMAASFIENRSSYEFPVCFSVNNIPDVFSSESFMKDSK